MPSFFSPKDAASSGSSIPHLDAWRGFFELGEERFPRAEVRDLWLAYRNSGLSPYREPEIWTVPDEGEGQKECRRVVETLARDLVRAGETGFLLACVEATGVVAATASDPGGTIFAERPFGVRAGTVLSFPPYPATAYALARKEGTMAWLVGAEHPHVVWHRSTSLAIPLPEPGNRTLVAFFRGYPPVRRIATAILAALANCRPPGVLELPQRSLPSLFTALRPLFSFLAHEIFNPLTHIRGFLELRAKGGEREALLRDAAHIERTLRAFLLLSEPHGREVESVVDFRALLRTAVDQATRISPLAIALPQKPLLVRGDPLRLEIGLHLALTWLQMLGDPFPSLVSGTREREAFLRLGGAGPVPRSAPPGETTLGQGLEAEEVLFALATRLLTESGARVDPPEAEGEGWRVTVHLPLAQEADP
ncbi:MAG: hypothetical protein KM296_01890 [Brockia lithotrophica]|nr:hypothetical protein [Brockia lithotrophica]